jgi:hypothetical protein
VATTAARLRRIRAFMDVILLSGEWMYTV